MANRPTIGAFELLDQVAEGGMGTIWRARHTTEGDVVAVKFVTAQYAHQQRYRDGFRREVEAVAGLSHPGIVAVYDYGEVGALAASMSEQELVAGMPWLAMEHAALGNLEQVVVESWGELRVILYDVLDALAHAHSRGVIHRDLKPPNILMTQTADDELLLKLSDFGIAQLGRDNRQDSNEIFGTPTYMAPEQFSGRVREQGPWTDLYALGVMAYELLCGAPPFAHSGFFSLAQAHLTDNVPPLKADFETPGGLQDWVRRLLAKAPRDRFSNAADARWALQRLDPFTEKSPIRMRLEDVPRTEFTVRADWASARTLPLIMVDESYEADPTAGFARPTGSQAPIPSSWRATDAAARTRALMSGVGLGLFGLRPVPFVGREHERDVIWQTLRVVDRERRPRAVVIRGEAGCGKSRLVEWTTQRAVELGAAELVVARHDSMGTGASQLATSLGRAFRVSDDDRRQAYEMLAGLLEPELAAAVSALITGDGGGRGDIEAVDFGGDTERYAAALGLLSHASEARPVIVWIDDAQWGPDMVAFAEHVLASDPHVRLLFLCTVRTGFTSGDDFVPLGRLCDHERTTELSIAALDEADCREQIERMLRLPEDVVAGVAERSEGNPLFAVQLVGDWVERGLLVRGDGGFELSDGATAIPDDIHGLWLQRVADLERRFGTAAPRALRVAAAIGDEVGHQMWRLCCEAVGFEIAPGLTQAMVARRLAHRTDDGFRFAHRMFRESLERAAREDDTWVRDNGACAAILDLLHPDPEPPIQTRAALHLVEATAFSDALDMLFDATQTLLAQEDLGELEAVIRIARDAHNLAGIDADDERTGRLRQVEVKLHRHRGQFSKSDPQTLALLSDARLHGWASVEASALFDAGATQALVGEIHDGRRMLFEAVELFPEEQRERQRALAYKHMSHVYGLRGNSTAAAQAATDAFQLFTTLRDTGQKAWCLYYLGLARRVAGGLDDARRRLSDALSFAEDAGLRDLQANCHNVLADLARMSGDYEAASDGYRRAEQIWRAIDSANVAAAQFNIAMSDLQRAKFGLARQRLTTLAAEFEGNKQRIPLAATHIALLACAAHADDVDGAGAHLAHGRRLLDETGLVDPDVLIALEVAQACLAANQRAMLLAETAKLAEEQRLAMT